jgi:serpin B
VNAGHRYLRDLLAKGDPTVTTRAANGMWLNPVEPDVLPEFAQRNQDFYGATFFRDDIHGDAGVNRMDAWVREQTGGKIFGLVKRDDLSEEARIVLVNAIYFKGQWAVAFDKAQTGDIDFYLAEGKTEMVPTMRRKGTFSYCETDDAQIINLPYGQGRLAILIALPKPRLALPMLTAKANVDTWRLWLASLKDTENLTLRLPRFRVATDFQLNDALRGVGMARAFNGAGPDFSLMNGVKTAGFDRVRHKAMLETSEDGVAPAAPAGAGVGPKMTINRPFLYAIHDKDTGAILLLGTVGNP